MDTLKQYIQQISSVFQSFFRPLKQNSRLRNVVIGLVAVAVIAGAYWFFDGKLPWLTPRYTQAYSLVNDKVSQNATIAIHLPAEVSKTEAKNSITFTPDIKGQWLEQGGDTELLFKPATKLKLNRYYAVTLTTIAGVIGKDFLVVEDPRIEAIFPKVNSETHEKSEITIIFNRPMVPLTTLDELETKDIPVEITPATPGRFKWIGTQTLQFIPQTTLAASANYTVNVKAGLVSLDGLAVAATQNSFMTRPLRYEHVDSGSLVYNRPIQVTFNQPVNLEKTAAGITVENTTRKHNIEFIAEYGKKSIYNPELKKDVEETDKSIVLIYPAKDQYGRPRLWNFTEEYYLNIQTAYPEFGDIIIEEDRGAFLQVTDIIKDISASSKRTSYAASDFFDPQGKLIVTFFEEIDLNASKIEADSLADIKYGEKCKTDSEGFSPSEFDCDTEPDHTKLVLEFAADKLSDAQKVTLHVKKIKNKAGLQLNRQEIIKEIKVVPGFSIRQSVPEHNTTNADLIGFTICSTVPLARPAAEDAKKVISMNKAYEFGSWSDSYRLGEDEKTFYYFCPAGHFQTKIYYGLMPNEQYAMKIALEDVFGRKLDLQRNFTTGSVPQKSLNFFHFQNSYNVTTVAKTKLTYAVQNMDYVNVHICEMEAKDMLGLLENKPDYRQAPSAVKGCRGVKEARIDLPKKYWVKNYFQFDLKKYLNKSDLSGHYLLTFSHPDYKARDWQTSTDVSVYERTYLSITNLSVVEKKVEVFNNQNDKENVLGQTAIDALQNVYWVTEIGSLAAVSDARLEFYTGPNRYDDGALTLQAASTQTTDAQGIAAVKPLNNLRGVVITSGNDSAILAASVNKLEDSSTAYDTHRFYVYTDRPIYRPGDQVFLKGIYRLGYDGNYEIVQGMKVPIKIFNSRGQEIFSKEIELNEFGTIGAELMLDSKAALGTYRIQAKNDYSYFDVEEYVPAAFKVELKSDQEEYISKDTISLNVDANYYFGVPLEGGEVEYGITSQDYNFDKYQDEYFSFGSGWYRCYYDCSFNDKFVLRNKVSLNERGQAVIHQPIDFNALFKNEDNASSKIFNFYVTVKNTSGQAVTQQKSFVIHQGEFYLGIKSDSSFLAKNEATRLRLKSVNIAGKPLAADDIKLTVSKINWVYNKRQEVDGGYYYHYEKKLDPVITKSVYTNRDGDWQDMIQLDKEGEFEVVAQAKDKRGNIVSSVYNVYVYGEGQVEVSPSNDTSLEVITDNSQLNVGDQASIIIKSPFARAKALISIERGQVFKYEIVDINQNLFNYAFPLDVKYVPNVIASVTLLSPDPEVKYGQTEFQINTKEKELSVAIFHDKEQYLPGEEVMLNIEVKDSAGKPVAGELSIAVVDMSVLALKGNPKKNPVPFFYAGFPHTVSTISNIKNILYIVDIPAGGKGGGGGEPEDLAKKKRGVFKDTAYWRTILVTDGGGKVQTSFHLPDNLTTWQVESVAVTKDTKLGVGYSEFTARKNLMVTPLQPRFIVPGDEFLAGAKIFNQTGSRQKVEVNFISDSLKLLDKKSVQTVTLGQDDSATLYFKVRAPEEIETGEHVFTLSASNDAFRDTVETSISITRNDTYETTASAGYSAEERTEEFVYLPDNVVKDKGHLTIQSSATLAVFLSDALNSILAYPYGCSEQVASKLQAIAIIKKGLNLENIGDTFQLKEIEFEGKHYSLKELVEVGLTRLAETQQPNGAFSYYANLEPDYYLSLQVANSLKDLSDAGFDINTDSLSRLQTYLNDNYHFRAYQYEDKIRKYNDAVFAAYTLQKIGESNINQDIIQKLNELLRDKQALNEKMSNLALTQLAIFLARDEKTFAKKYQEQVYAIVENKIDIDARGAFLPINNSNLMWQYYETSIKDTAGLLKALSAAKRDNEIVDRLVRWLVASRAKDGAWGSTNNTLSVVDAFTDYLQWREENKSEFDLTIVMNGQETAKVAWSPANILEQRAWVTPLADLKVAALNTILFRKENKNNLSNNFYYDLALKYFLPVNQLPPRDEGFTISRELTAFSDKEGVKSLTSAKVGDVLHGRLRILTPRDRSFVAIEDFIPAGAELVNFNLETTDQSLQTEDYKSGGEPAYENEEKKYSRRLMPDIVEYRDDRLFIFAERLPAGSYEYDYYLRVLIPGTFHYLPAVASEMYFPENFGRTRGNYFVVEE